MKAKSTEDRLIQAARAACANAYAPYSGFLVGAAVRSEGGHVYVGANVENASYGATICAERAAIAAMVAAGETRIAAVAVFTEGNEPAMPCGVCRQVIHELGAKARIVSATPRARVRTTAKALLPKPFVLRKR